MDTLITLLLMSSSVSALVLAARLQQLHRRFTPKALPVLPGRLEEVPTVSICIPARNETHAMTQCLENVISSRYPKLEIIVLDDGSTDNTSILIKSFAHAGVRFVEGSPLPPGWLGKNHAEHDLLAQASGEYVVFLDVDTHIQPRTIDGLIAEALQTKADMVSVLPMRDDALRASVLFATLRHFWSILRHTRAVPAVSSSLWMVRRAVIDQEFPEFSALSAVVEPERVIAARLAQRGRYRFFFSAATLGVTYEKKWSSQCETSIRLLYPMVGSSLVGAIGLCLFLLVLLLPFVVVASGLMVPWSAMHWLGLGSACLLMALYIVYVQRVWRRGSVLGGVLFPLIIVQECWLLLASVHAYRSGTVTWKGRPISKTS